MFPNKVSQQDAVQAFLVKDGNGVVDIDASCAKFRDVALRISANQQSDNELLAHCLSAVFDTHRGACLNMAYIQSETIKLMAQKKVALKEPSVFPMLQGKVKDLMQDAMKAGMFSMRKGPGGGYQRSSDVTAPVVK